MGVLLFMFPISYQGEITIPISILTKLVATWTSSFIKEFILITILISALASIYCRIAKPHFILERKYLRNLFYPHPLILSTRITAAILAILIWFQVGPEAIWSDTTGGMIYSSLLTTLIAVFLLAGLTLPLLINFGLTEFVGVLLSRIMRPLFRLPGTASVDCMASWLGDGTIGILLTNKQYKQGIYTAKEAAIIATSFSAVSITFCLVVIETVGLGHLFVPFFATVSFVGFILAIVTSRIPPLSTKKNTYLTTHHDTPNSTQPENQKLLAHALSKAYQRASQNTSVLSTLKEGFSNVFDMWIGVIPIILTVGTAALIVTEYTPLFQYLGYPIVPILELLQLPEAQAASETIFVGFADMFIPSLMASATIQSPITLFTIAVLSVTQLIYMAEVGSLILASSIPISFLDLLIIFLQRTIIALPLIVIIAHIIF